MRVTARRLAAVVRATAVELLGEPFVFLTWLTALSLTVLAPSFNCHQFGEPARMARDAGFSSFLLGGSVALVFGAIRSVRREIEGGTCESAIAHAVSPAQFLLAKVAGILVAGAAVLTSVFALTLVLVNGMEIGGAIAAKTGGLVRPWGVSLALGVAVLLLPVLAAAALNRFARFRFTLTASVLTAALSIACACVPPRAGTVAAYLPVFVLAAVPVLLLAAAAGVIAFRFRANVAATLTGLLALLTLPALGNYCLSEALAGGGRVPGAYLGLALAAAVPALGALVLFGWILAVRQEGFR